MLLLLLIRSGVYQSDATKFEHQFRHCGSTKRQKQLDYIPRHNGHHPFSWRKWLHSKQQAIVIPMARRIVAAKLDAAKLVVAVVAATAVGATAAAVVVVASVGKT